MRMAKREVRQTSGDIDESRIIGDSRSTMDRLIDGDVEYLGQIRVTIIERARKRVFEDKARLGSRYGKR